MMFLWLPFLLLIAFAIFWMARPGASIGGCGMSHVGHDQTGSPTQPRAVPDAVEIARRRLAMGEITTSEYEQIRKLLG